MRATSLAAIVSLATAANAANYTLVKDYSGSSFFDDWDFYGDSNVGVNNTAWNGSAPFDDLTNGKWSRYSSNRIKLKDIFRRCILHGQK